MLECVCARRAPVSAVGSQPALAAAAHQAMEPDRHDVVGGLVGPPSKRQWAEAAEPPASLVLLAADDGSRHVVPRIAALGVSELLAELLGEDEEGAEAELVVPVPTSGTATAAFAAFVQRQRAPHPAGPGPGPGPVDGQQPLAAVAVAFPAAEWRAAAFFMATTWQRELSRAWGEGILTATAGLAAAVETAAEVMDPAVSPLLTMLPAASLAAIFVATGGGNQIGGWVVRELDSPSRRAEGWLVVGDDDGFAKAKQQAKKTLTHIVIKHGTTQIGNEAFCGCSLLASVAIPGSVTQIGYWAFHGCSSLASVAIPDSVTRIGNGAFAGCPSLLAFEQIEALRVRLGYQLSDFS
eukprot:SAG31_NODE_2008_length_6673_cov_3.990265_8_plen_352_part_00